MFNPIAARLATISLALLSLVMLAVTSCSSIVASGARKSASAAGAGLVVHEWGTFTSVTARDGQSLVWRPLSVESDLPSFIYSIDKGQSWRGLQYRTKSGLPVRVRMETPVLYFYAQQEMTANVKVDFPTGKITEWYPQARSVPSHGIDWGEVKIMPGLRVELAHDLRENHYYPARDTDAAIVEAGGEKQTEHEKFLFYRGVGNFDLPLSLKLVDDKVIVKNITEEKLAQAVLFENRGGQTGFRMLDLSNPEATWERPVLGSNPADLHREMKSMLMAEGLYDKEAEAMLNTWRDSWFEEGLRLFYVVPRRNTDAIIPISIRPEPAALVRVLVGRTELITPEMEADVTSQIVRLDEPSTREAALKAIKKYGRFVEAILSQINFRNTDPKVKTAVNRLLDEMK
ncbi:MAG: hypothetical protein JWM21_4445 [Acidobacteria bacterium]|nr:hypothetical protein [Acidobacteriota bacterium]